jgi:cell division protein FtsZ
MTREARESAVDLSGVRNPRVAVVGVGGGGNNALRRLIECGFDAAETVAINTDARALEASPASRKLLLAEIKLRGRGCGGDPRIGAEAAWDAKQAIHDILWDKDLVFAISALGGGTGTGATPIVCDVVKERGGIAVPIATLPFAVEKHRFSVAVRGLRELAYCSDAVIVLDNNKLLDIAPSIPVRDAFSVMEQVIADSIMGILGTYTMESVIQIDFSDVKAVLQGGRQCTLLYGESSSSDPDRAVQDALRSSFLRVRYSGAQRALVHITGDETMSIHTVNKIAEGITSVLDHDAVVKVGLSVSPEFSGRVRVMGIITNVSSEYLPSDEPVMAAEADVVMEKVFAEMGWKGKKSS